MALILSSTRSTLHLAKRVKLESTTLPVLPLCLHRAAASRVVQVERSQHISSSRKVDVDANASRPDITSSTSPASSFSDLTRNIDEPRLPRAVQATYLRPLRRKAQHAMPACDLQLRSYSARNLEFASDFALRAAYYLKIPISGPVPLPKLIERWTVSRGPHVHKKTPENFERITMRRLIQAQDAHPDVVQVWLAYIRKHAYYGVGMKANIWEYEQLGVGKELDSRLETMRQDVDSRWTHFGRRKNSQTAEQVMELMEAAEVQRSNDVAILNST